ncbi:DUF1652 domain-containing protein [Azomonas macrocytogenes]|uniref:DUF1652 domain-containing protein n=1 Tax=Azomonas macrocytogenes TaxID=69962 RepID=A0A839T8R4_AZOMA|nr:DUF1652 domain-containing protein [Azomonas macrocytogenes]MBB3104385.1 hypothetical protein [Azomonas macrocytogenes]
MGTRLTSAKIEAILRDHLHPYHCECRTAGDNSLSVRLYRETYGLDEMTALGISAEQCRDAANLIRLAQELRIELDATRSSFETDEQCSAIEQEQQAL